MKQVAQWTVFEQALTSARHDGDETCELSVVAHFAAPSGRSPQAQAFWDGGPTWRARLCPDEAGLWRWRSECSDPSDAGLHGREGTFECLPYDGPNLLFQHGKPRVSDNGRHFLHADGTPFLWLGDTCWNGVLRATDADWTRYLQTRSAQGFTVIQFFSAHWRGLPRDAHGECAFYGENPVRLNPSFFQRLDPKVAAINQHGLLASAIILLALKDEDDGLRLPVEDVVRISRYLLARWDAYHIAWTLGGDGDFRGERAERWKAVGRQVFGAGHSLATMHPCGWVWVADEFRDEPWFDFIGYQSCHAGNPDVLRWFVLGPPAQEWLKPPARPIVNLEPNYEAHPAYDTKRPFTDWDVRRAAYWSLLISPPAGVAYGHHHIWPWSTEPEDQSKALFGTDWGELGPWTNGLEAPGARSITVLRRFFESGEWWRLRPAPAMVVDQPGEEDPYRFVAAAATEQGDWAVIYLPRGGEVSLRAERLKRPARARWFDPRAGEWREAGELQGERHAFRSPDDRDWVLDLRAG